LSHTTRI